MEELGEFGLLSFTAAKIEIDVMDAVVVENAKINVAWLGIRAWVT